LAGIDSGSAEAVDLVKTGEWNARHAEKAGAPVTARIIRSVAALAASDSVTGRRVAGWANLTVEDAMQLRVAGGLHYLHLTGEEDRLAPIYAGLVTDQSAIDGVVREVVERFDHLLLAWLDHPPQTNEAGRSAAVMAALLWLSGKLGPKFELNEIGASAGVNTMMGRYRYDLGGVKVGPSLSRMMIAPEWRGSAPPDNRVEIVEAKGCDLLPRDLTDPDQAMKLRAYIWPEMIARMARLDTAIEIAQRAPPELVQMNAGGFVDELLKQEQEAGVTRVLFHTIVWQYIPEPTREAITSAMEGAGARTSADRPLAWIKLETNQQTFRHELSVRYWNGSVESGSGWALLATAHPHGEWVEWSGG